jgi:hypothetical protein
MISYKCEHSKTIKVANSGSSQRLAGHATGCSPKSDGAPGSGLVGSDLRTGHRFTGTPESAGINRHIVGDAKALVRKITALVLGWVEGSALRSDSRGFGVAGYFRSAPLF